MVRKLCLTGPRKYHFSRYACPWGRWEVSTSQSHFHDWIGYSGIAFFSGVTRMRSHILRDFAGEKSLVNRDLKWRDHVV